MTTTAPFISREDVEALRDYVMAPSGQKRADSTVLIHVSHSNLKSKFFELRLDRHMTIEALKVKLSFHVGSNPSAMVLQLLDDQGNMVASMWEDQKKLGFYSPHDGYTIHIVDTDPNSASANGWLEDTSLVQKYVMSDEEYNKRENSYRKWKDSKLKEDPSWTLEKEMAKRRGVELAPAKEKIQDPDHLQEAAQGITVGSRCCVDPGERRGEVKFVGNNIDGLPLGWWVGVQFDEPLGKGDGSVKGKRFFECESGYGGFVRPDKVQVGDYPAIDEFAEEDEDEI